MNKEQVYVPLLTPEDCKRAYEILSKAGVELSPASKSLLIKGDSTEFPFLMYFNRSDWALYSSKETGRKEITLDQLSEMLMGKGEIIHPDSKKGVFVTRLLEIMDGDYYNFQEQADAVMRKVQEYTDQQTLELRKELEEKEARIKRLENVKSNVLKVVKNDPGYDSEWWSSKIIQWELFDKLNPTT